MVFRRKTITKEEILGLKDGKGNTHNRGRAQTIFMEINQSHLNECVSRNLCFPEVSCLNVIESDLTEIGMRDAYYILTNDH